MPKIKIHISQKKRDVAKSEGFPHYDFFLLSIRAKVRRAANGLLSSFQQHLSLSKQFKALKQLTLYKYKISLRVFFPCAGQFPITSERKVLFGAAGSDDPGPLLLLKQRFLSSWAAFFFKGQTLSSFYLQHHSLKTFHILARVIDDRFWKRKNHFEITANYLNLE